MDRLELINQLIEKNNFKNYVEIGVSKGKVFFDVTAENKFAIDPFFRFSKTKRLIKRITSKSNYNAKYFDLKSDDFFSMQTFFSEKNQIDICLVDGMHEFRYALNDVLNTLKYLSHDGVIIMHDCNPNSTESASSFKEWQEIGFKGDWNGDVWKTILYLRSFHKEIDVFVADCDYGLGIITKKESKNLSLSFENYEQIDNLNYEDLNNNRNEWLNIKSIEYLKDNFQI